MKTKECRNCGHIKPLSDYYKHKQMWDGHLNKCKECVKHRVAIHREKNIEKVREYDRNRPNEKERAIAHKERVKNLPIDKKEAYKKVKDKKISSPEYKNKQTVNRYLNNAIRDKRIEKLNYCEHCSADGVDIQGHQPDYLKPLDVIWLCASCHGKEHK